MHDERNFVASGLGSQEDLMAKDQCITVDDADNIRGHASKYDVHRFNPSQPRGVLHRAFSVFLFDSQNRLLLQQRWGFLNNASPLLD